MSRANNKKIVVDVSLDTTNFNQNLDNTITDVQKLADAVDDLVLGGGSLVNIVEDLTPQLGGDLDLNGSSIVTLANTGTGTALTFTSITNSAIEADVITTSATTVSGGNQIFSNYVDATATQSILTQEIPSDLRLGSNISGVSDIIWIDSRIV